MGWPTEHTEYTEGGVGEGMREFFTTKHTEDTKDGNGTWGGES